MISSQDMGETKYVELGESSNTKDELDTQNSTSYSCSNQLIPCQEAHVGFGEATTSNSARSSLISHFVGMGFSEDLVIKEVNENGEENTDLILEALLAYTASPECEPLPLGMQLPDGKSDCEGDSLYDEISDAESCLGSEEDGEQLSEKDKKLLHLVEMGFAVDEVSSALDICGPDISIMDLMDFISASQMVTTTNSKLHESPHIISDGDEEHLYSSLKSGPALHRAGTPNSKKRKMLFEEDEKWKSKIDFGKKREKETWKKGKKPVIDDDDDTLHLPKLMIGFGVPSNPVTTFPRTLPDAAIGPPYFYYENVACTPKGVWSTISRFLFEIEPEFVDSVHFSACARKRGYVHNLPISNRFPLQPIPPLTIQEAFPLTKRWWPKWDPRTKLNCINTCTASAKLTEKIRVGLEDWGDGDPPLKVQNYVLHQCRKWNLVWVGKNKVAALEPDEIELLLGYPRNHTRGGGISRTDRLKSLGNSFQVDTVAYHFSVLKNMFPNGISVLSLFSGIGGAEVALHRLGIPLKTVVSVEISEVNRNILRSWWEETNQTGTLIHIDDVQQLGVEQLEKLISKYGGFDFVVGGSPCNNLTGSNRISRDGLEGKHSVLFYDFFRILDSVKCLMGV